MNSSTNKPAINSGNVSGLLLAINIIVAIIYFSWWFIPGHMGNPILFGLLFFGEFYHVGMALMFWSTIRLRINPELKHFIPDVLPHSHQKSVAVFITVAGEPVEVVKQTAIAAKKMRYGKHKIYILNDGYVAKKDNWQDIEKMAQAIGVTCITRKVGGGAKAGNINNALRHTTEEYIAIFDADMVPYSNFMEKVMPYFSKDNVAYVQTPQYYKNWRTNEITAGAWEQQDLFFGPIMEGKNSVNAAFICGTNVVLRRTALEQVGGMFEKNIAEDFLTSLFIHQRGWVSHYIKEVLAEGLAPEDLLSYYKQQLRWARGSLEVLFSANPLFKKNLTWRQKMQYLSSALYWLNGVIVLIDISMPIIFLLTGLQPVAATTTSFALFFVPFMFLNLYTLYIVSGRAVTFRAISFSQSSWTLQLVALFSVIFKQKMSFSVTPKQAQQGNFLSLALPHLLYVGIAIVAIYFGIMREGMNPSIATNTAWVLFNVIMFFPFIVASFPWGKTIHKEA